MRKKKCRGVDKKNEKKEIKEKEDEKMLI